MYFPVYEFKNNKKIISQNSFFIYFIDLGNLIIIINKKKVNGNFTCCVI